MKRLIIIISLIFLIMPMVIAESDITKISPVQQGKLVNLQQTCANCTYVNITKLSSPSSLILLTGALMTKNGNAYNYTFRGNQELGTYIVNTCGDLDGYVACDSFTYDVTPSGKSNLLGVFLIVITFIYAIAFFGFFGKNEWLAILGGMGMITLGLFTLNNGIDIYRSFITETFSWTTIGIGAFFSITAGMSIIEENLQ